LQAECAGVLSVPHSDSRQSVRMRDIYYFFVSTKCLSVKKFSAKRQEPLKTHGLEGSVFFAQRHFPQRTFTEHHSTVIVETQAREY
jgi:hypothetical protein